MTAQAFFFGEEIHAEGLAKFQAPGRSMMPVDQQVSMHEFAVRLLVPEMSDDPRIDRVDMWQMLRIDPTDIDAVSRIVFVQLNRFATVLHDFAPDRRRTDSVSACSGTFRLRSGSADSPPKLLVSPWISPASQKSDVWTWNAACRFSRSSIARD